MKKFFYVFATAMLLAFVSASYAQPGKVDILIGTGGAGNTYDVMMRELLDRCGSVASIGTTTSTGSIENIDNVLANRRDGAIVQEDSLFMRKASNPKVERLKTLVALHPEEVHVIAHKQSGLFGVKTTLGFDRKGDPIVFKYVSDLSNYKIAAAGGSHDTARLIGQNADITWEVVKAQTNDQAIAMLNSGQVQAVLIVAGAPSGFVEKLPAGKYKMLPFANPSVSKLVAIYGQTTLSYSNLDAEGVQSVTTNADLVTREYTDPKILASLAKFRACAQNAVPSLKDTRGTHEKWQQVNPAYKGKWPWFDLR